MRYRTLLTARTMGALAFGLVLLCTRAVNAQEIVTLIDTTGASVKLTTFGVHLDEGKGDLSHHGDSVRSAAAYPYFFGYEVYSHPPAIPIRLANGVFQFVPFGKISEYQADGKTATIILVGGGRLVGSPLSECTFDGEGALGKVSLPARQVRTLKFNPEKAKEYLDGQEKDSRRKGSEIGWSGKFKTKATLTLVSGDEVRLQSLVFFSESAVSECDESYIPCKPYSSTVWFARGGFPVKYGAMEVELDFTKMQSMELTAPAKPVTTPVSFDIALLSGEKVTATLNLGKGSKAVGLLGTTEDGYAHVPLGRIKSITFMNGS